MERYDTIINELHNQKERLQKSIEVTSAQSQDKERKLRINKGFLEKLEREKNTSIRRKGVLEGLIADYEERILNLDAEKIVLTDEQNQLEDRVKKMLLNKKKKIFLIEFVKEIDLKSFKTGKLPREEVLDEIHRLYSERNNLLLLFIKKQKSRHF